MALIKLHLCAGLSEPLLVVHTTFWKSNVAAHIVLADLTEIVSKHYCYSDRERIFFYATMALHNPKSM